MATYSTGPCLFRICLAASPPTDNSGQQFVARQPDMLEDDGAPPSRGLVMPRNDAGTDVADATAVELPPHVELVIALECLAARLASRRMSQAQRAELHEFAVQLGSVTAKPEVESLYATDRVFHELIWSGSCNPVLVDRIRALRRQPPLSFQCVRLDDADRRVRYAEHLQIIEALNAGDAEGAAEAMSRHLEQESQRAQTASAGIGVSIPASFLGLSTFRHGSNLFWV